MLDFRYLRAFAVAARHLNFSKAAKELRISPSALSRQVRLLEQSAGAELFIRNTRRVSLSAFGRKVFSSVEKLQRELVDSDVGRPLRIGCLQSVFEFVLVDLIQRYPRLFDGQLEIVIDSPESLQRKAIEGELDLSFTNLAPLPGSNLSGLKLFQESISWVGTRAHPKSGRPIIFSAFEQYYPEDALTAKNWIRVNSFNATVALTRGGIGRALVALPPKLQTIKSGRGKQWIYVVTPNYQKAPDQLKRLLELMKVEFCQ